MKTILTKVKKQVADYKLLLRNVPAVIISLFVLSVVMMNLMANKTILERDWIALDGGILISWLSFLTMDVITKHFGPKAATKLSFFAAGVNLLTCLIFFIASIIPTEADYAVFNQIFGGTWFILLNSTIAFLISGVLNNFLNWSVGKMFDKNPDGKLAYMTRTYVSTFIGQFVDNLIFSCLTFMLFAPIFWDGYSWTLIQCGMCALTGAVVELLFEVIFSPIGYRVCKKWKAENVGKEYIERTKR